MVPVIKEFLVSRGDQKVKSGMNPTTDVSTEVGIQEGFLEEEG